MRLIKVDKKNPQYYLSPKIMETNLFIKYL